VIQIKCEPYADAAEVGWTKEDTQKYGTPLIAEVRFKVGAMLVSANAGDVLVKGGGDLTEEQRSVLATMVGNQNLAMVIFPDTDPVMAIPVHPVEEGDRFISGGELPAELVNNLAKALFKARLGAEPAKEDNGCISAITEVTGVQIVDSFRVDVN
jgi:hypothetical protein